MNIAFFTEMPFKGKVPHNYPNMRTEFSWMVALDSDHYNLKETPTKKYDLGIIIIPKNNPEFNLEEIKQHCGKVAVMQEGPHWYFQDYPIKEQINYFNTLVSADTVLVHNKVDKIYYEGLIGHKDVRIMKSLMIEKSIGELKEVNREGVIIGGNFVNWYGGFDSYIVANSQFDKITAPTMGRKQDGEEQLISLLPYMTWKEWIHKLNEFKIGVHLMRTHAAGTFALNCAYLGIPCIGYKGLDTQELCHPELTVEIGSLGHAKELIKELNNNSEFYNECSKQAINNYNTYFHESKFKI
tara:strand:- start:1133 stop:2023 length:891 start_codon:yes stop_codon:yes gene_type:complete